MSSSNFDDDLEWDESKRTKTAWSLATRQRSKRTYGRRSTSTGNLQLPPQKTYGKRSSAHNNSRTVSYAKQQESKLERSTQQLFEGTNSFHSSSTTTQSQSKRSLSLNSFGEIGFDSINEENRNPNIKESFTSIATTTQESYSASSSGNKVEFGNRFHDSLTFSTNSSSCFSSLCNTNRGSNTIFSSFNEDNNDSSSFLSPCLTPSRSISSSSRKRGARGVCESPLLHCDDVSSSSGLSAANLLSTSSYGSRRARSRIFSPESTKKIMAAAAAAAAKEKFKDGSMEEQNREQEPDEHCNNHDNEEDKKKKRNGRAKKIERMTTLRTKNESFNESESEMELDLDDVDNSFSFHNTSCELSQIDLEESEKTENQQRQQNHQTNNEAIPKKKNLLPLQLMPRRMSSVGNMSFEDAIFGPVESNKMERGDAEKNESIFDTMSSYEDLKFLIKELRRWSSGKLLASFGMNKNCTVVPPNSWSSSRRAAFVYWTTFHLGFCHKCCGGSVSYLQISESKAKEVQKDLEKALLEYKENCKNKENKVLATEKKKKKLSVAYDTPLPMSSIKISKLDSRTTPKFTPMSVGFHSISFTKAGDDMVNDLAGDLKSLNIFKQPLSSCLSSDNKSERRKSGSTPLARMVTLPDEMPTSAISKPPRLSYDNSIMDTKDFVSHMHGISPQFCSKKVAKPAALALPRRQHTTGTIPLQSPAIPIITAALSFDQVETPGVHKLNNRRWGSRPIEGKDWGESVQCEEKIIEFLSQEVEEQCSNISNCVPDSNQESTSCHVRPGMSCVRANSMSLGIEFEGGDSLHPDGFDRHKEHIESPPPSNEGHHEDSEANEDLVDDQNQVSELGMLDEFVSPEKAFRRRVQSFAKRNRMSICHSALNPRRETFRGASLQNRMSFAQELSCIEQKVPGLSILDEESSILKNDLEIPSQLALLDAKELLPEILSYLTQRELQSTASLVCTKWADAATDALASLMFISVGCSASDDDNIESIVDDDEITSLHESHTKSCSIAISMQRSWEHMTSHYPWGAYLAEGTFKRVFRVWNTSVGAEEAISVMDVAKIHDKNIVGNELAISVMLSSLTIRHVCPNFLRIREVFTSEYEPPRSHWGCADNKQPLGKFYNQHLLHQKRKPRKPSSDKKGDFQYIRMELCKYGDVEEYIKKQPNALSPPDTARCLLFQMAYSLHVAGDRFGLKHYDIKLLNFFLQAANDGKVDCNENPFTMLRYGLGSHVFNLRMQTSEALIVKLADFGTANTRPESDGQPVMLNNFTTLENTPPDFMILGDAAVQGYGHDSFGLGLCMLHLFTGDAPYEEILETIKCPTNFRKKLKRIWEGKGRNNNGYTVIHNVITLDVLEDEFGNIEGEIDETLYDTLYRYLVLFGVPEEKFQWKEGCKVWNAISSCLEQEHENSPNKIRRSRRNNNGCDKRDNTKGGLDLLQYKADCELFSLQYGKDERIARARANLQSMDGGMELLMSLVSFDPRKRASALDVINSTFMSVLREERSVSFHSEDDIIHSYLSYLAIQY